MARTLVVTGAASGIGLATAQLLQEQGHTVIRVDREEGDVTGDLGSPEATTVVHDVARLSGGTVDGLVANAGVSSPTDLALRINYFGTV